MASLGEAWLGAPDSARRSALTQAGAYPLAIGVGLFVVWLIGRRARSRERAGLRFRWSDVPRAGLALVLIAPFYLLVSEVAQAVFRAMNGAAPSPIQHEALKTLSAGHADGWAWGMVAGAVIGAPIVEELTFRVFVQGSVLRFVTAVGGTGDGGSAPGWTAWIAAVLTSGVWTATHVSSVPPIALPGLFVLGLGFGMAYERTQRLGVPIVMHMIFNAMNIVAVFAGLAG
jgi:membrane protease YdiL (CAAX protease family)